MNNLNTKVITGKVRFSYANVWEPKSINGSNPKYSISLLIPKSDTQTLSNIKQAIENAKQVGLSTFNGKIPANLKAPLRDGDIERPDDDIYKGCYFINANSINKPGILDKYKNPITNREDFYSGCYGYASINFYAFNTNGNKGIACGLNNLMKIEDGEALGGRASAEMDFGSITAEVKEETEELFA